MTSILTTPPSNNEVLRKRLYAGAIYRLAPTMSSKAFVREAQALLTQTFGDQPRRVHDFLSPQEVFAGVGRMRRTIYLDTQFHALLIDTIQALGFDPERVAFDPARLRAVLHDGHHNPAAAAAYFPHRDTWYANPQATITCWLPLHDLTEEETFAFYPHSFRTAVPNDSAAFDYDQWVDRDWRKKIGWQDEDTGSKAHYPASQQPSPSLNNHQSTLRFSCSASDNLLFSGAHFHRTTPQSTGQTRFSLDFRIAHLDDVAAGRGAPNVDNLSRGSCMRDYVYPGKPWPPTR